MQGTTDEVTFQFPRESIQDMLKLSESLTRRMHELLERNTDGQLSEVEKEELTTLVEMCHFGELLSMSLKKRAAS